MVVTGPYKTIFEFAACRMSPAHWSRQGSDAIPA
jgi:hypothetical protein